MNEFAELPLLKEPPLLEVVYSLQVISQATLDGDQVMEGVKKDLGEGWKVAPINRLHVNIQAKPDTGVEHDQQLDWHGLKCTSTTGRSVIHMMRHGLFMNFLPPYKGFPECIKEVQRAWAVYASYFAPQQISLCGIRYINQVQVPLLNGVMQFDRYFKFLTLYPLEGEFQLHRFHHQFEVSEPEYQLPARVIFTSVNETEHALDVVLDIEAFDDRAKALDSSEIWQSFDHLRHWAYKLFKNTLTPECFQRYQ